MKTCSSCKETKPVAEFCKKKAARDGYAYNCKVCNTKATQRWKQENPNRVRASELRCNAKNKAKIRERSRRRREQDPEYHRESGRRYKRRNAEAHTRYCLAWAKKNNPRKMREDPAFRMRTNLRTRTRHVMKGIDKTGSAVRDLGCSGEELRLHIESLWTLGMNWSTYGKGRGRWSLDHIMPLTAFDLSDRQQFLLACSYLNLRPMWLSENVKKGNKPPVELSGWVFA